MIQEFCDRCMASVGDIYDGGKNVHKTDIGHIVTGFVRFCPHYIICTACQAVLCKVMRDYIERRP